jgi:hypothetical protein
LLGSHDIAVPASISASVGQLLNEHAIARFDTPAAAGKVTIVPDAGAGPAFDTVTVTHPVSPEITSLDSSVRVIWTSADGVGGGDEEGGGVVVPELRLKVGVAVTPRIEAPVGAPATGACSDTIWLGGFAGPAIRRSTDCDSVAAAVAVAADCVDWGITASVMIAV